MEKAKGKVLSTKDDMAEVLITRGSMCGDSCSNCGMCENKGTRIIAKNLVGAQKGDSVELGISTSEGLKATALVYLIPVVVLIVSVILFLKAGLTEGQSVLLAFLIMAVWFALVFIAEKFGVFKNKINVTITEIIKMSAE